MLPLLSHTRQIKFVIKMLWDAVVYVYDLAFRERVEESNMHNMQSIPNPEYFAHCAPPSPYNRPSLSKSAA